MTKTLTTRLDDTAEQALEQLVQSSGKNASQVVRDLLVDAERNRILTQVRADAERLRNDPGYQAEIAEIQRVMEPLRAW